MNSHLDVGVTLGRVFELYRKHLGALIVSALVVFVPTAIVVGLLNSSDSVFLRLIGSLINFVVSFLYAAVVVKVVEADRTGGAAPSVSELFERAAPRVLPVIGVSILAAIGVMIGFIFLIIPGLILLVYWIALVPTVVVESDQPALSSFGRSMKLVSGNFWRVVLVALVVFLIVVALAIVVGALSAASAVVGVIGAIVMSVLLMPLSGLVQSSVYFDLREAHGELAGAAAGGQWAPPAAPGGPPPPPPAPPAAPPSPAAQPPAPVAPPTQAQPPADAPTAPAPAPSPPAQPAPPPPAPDAPAPPAPGGGVSSGDPLGAPDEKPPSQPPPSQPPPGAA